MIELRLEDVNLKEWTITGGIKSDVGINRTVPIHSKIKELVEKKYDKTSDPENMRVPRMKYRNGVGISHFLANLTAIFGKFPHHIFTLLVVYSFVILGGTDAQNHTKKCINRSYSADNLFSIGEAPNPGQGEI